MGDTTAASAQRKSRTKHHRITDGIGKFDTVLHGIDHLGSRTRLSDLLHGVLKRLTILRLEDGLCCRTDQLHAMLLQERVDIRKVPDVPPKVGRILSGFSFRIISFRTSTVKGSMYT